MKKDKLDSMSLEELKEYRDKLMKSSNTIATISIIISVLALTLSFIL